MNDTNTPAKVDALADLRNVESLYGIDLTQSITAVAELIEDRARLEWFIADIAKGDYGAGLYFDGKCWGAPYLLSNDGGFGGGVGEFRSPNFREAIDFFRVGGAE